MIRINYEIKVSPEERKGDTPLRFWIERPSTLHQKSSSSIKNFQLGSNFNKNPLSDSSLITLSHADSEYNISEAKFSRG